MDEMQKGTGRYEVRHWTDGGRYTSTFTDNWWRFLWLRLSRKVIYYKVMAS